jgi:DNA-binding transcriptional MocR family regulator
VDTLVFPQSASGGVSHLLQQLAANVWSSPATKRLLVRVERVYAARREALVHALARHGIEAFGESGLGVWVPLPEEAAIVQMLADRGWAESW